ncbi:hypothetical protein K0T92_04150 [Paenibacillus oenotherae]|uniref:Lipoprotein n=1 Tax=Paenibacillus oenotherae TaxID=1435645 RepID=A0ABS7D1V7_9BACL|nr:hypothetical protein [Paenibacillus oenotherae]MBW7473924.1 hypothetical protein [Paenibacillus oenotherae]
MIVKAIAKWRYTLIVACVILGMALASCGVNDPGRAHIKGPDASTGSMAADSNMDSKLSGAPDGDADSNLGESHQEYTFPKSVKLQFQPVEISELSKEQAGGTWEHTQTIPFGEIDGEPVLLEVYKTHDEEALCGLSYERVVLVEYKKEKYRYQDCFMGSLEEEHPEQHAALFLLGYKHEENRDSTRIVHGAVELSANGPGRMVYFYFDVGQGRWYGFEDWGFPRVVDLDGDGTAELVNQFQGLHMSWPDVTVYRWTNRSLEKSPPLKSALGVPNASYSTAMLDDQARINITAVMNVEHEYNVTASYRYNDGELKRVDVE